MHATHQPKTIISIRDGRGHRETTGEHSQECPEPLTTCYLQLITNGDGEVQQNYSEVCVVQAYRLRTCGIEWNCTRPSGEHVVVGPLPVDARRLRRRPEDDVEGVHDAGDVAQRRQEEGDEEL